MHGKDKRAGPWYTRSELPGRVSREPSISRGETCSIALRVTPSPSWQSLARPGRCTVRCNPNIQLALSNASSHINHTSSQPSRQHSLPTPPPFARLNRPVPRPKPLAPRQTQQPTRGAPPPLKILLPIHHPLGSSPRPRRHSTTLHIPPPPGGDHHLRLPSLVLRVRRVVVVRVWSASQIGESRQPIPLL